jgi:hypothetical protein
MRCPGQDTRYWKPGDIFDVECPGCGTKVEFFKDEARRRCPACKQAVLNPRMDFGCASYCRYAAECLGEVNPELAGERDDLFKDRVAVEVKRILGNDFQRIAHGIRVARLVESLGKEEKAAPAPLFCAAFLHLLWEEDSGGIDIPSGEKKALGLLEGMGARAELVEKTLGVITSFFMAGENASPETMVFSDAHQLALLEEGESGTQPEEGIGYEWRTRAGRALAKRMDPAHLQSD